MPPAPSSQKRSLETFSQWALIISIALAVLIVIPSASVPFLSTKTFVLAAGALVTLALFIVARLARGNIIFPPLLLVGAMWLPALAYVLSALFSGNAFAGSLWGTALEADTLAFMLAVSFLGTLAALMIRRPEHYRTFLISFAVLFGVVALLQALIVLVGQVAPTVISPAFSTLGSYEDLAFFLGLGVVGTLMAMRFVELDSRARRFLIGAGALALILLAIANSSLVWTLVALVSLGLFVEAVLRRSPAAGDADLEGSAIVNEDAADTNEGNRSLALPLIVLAISLFFLIGSTLGGALANSLNVNVTSVRPSWQSTFEVARDTYATSPVFGTGPSTFAANWVAHRDPSLNSTIFWNVDFNSGIGFVPTSFVTTGMAGVLAWLLLFTAFLFFGLRMLLRKAPADPFIRFVSILSFVGTLYLWTLAVWSLPNTVLLALGFVCAGIFASTMRYAGEGKQWGIVFARSPRVGFVIVFSLTLILLASVGAAYALVEQYIATTLVARAATAYSQGDLAGAEASAQSALNFAPSPLAYNIQAAIAGARLDEVMASTTLAAATAQQVFQAALSAGINAALTSTQLAPNNYQNWIALGDLYARAVPIGVTDAYESARTAYERASALNPTSPQIPYIMAQLEVAHDDLAAAKEQLRTAISLKQDYTAAIFLLSQLEVQTGNVREALAAALAAAYFTPNDPNVLFQVGILAAATNDLPGAAAALGAAVEANPEFANARYFLSAVLAKQGNMPAALEQLRAIAGFSPENAQALASLIAALEKGRNPFPANLLTIAPVPAE